MKRSNGKNGNSGRKSRFKDNLIQALDKTVCMIYTTLTGSIEKYGSTSLVKGDVQRSVEVVGVDGTI